MKIKDIRKKPTKCDAFSTLSTLNYALKIFGLSCIYRDGDKLRHSRPIWLFLFYIIFFFSANVFVLTVQFKMHSGKNRTTLNFEDSIQTSYLLVYVQYIFDVIFVYKYGRQCYVDYFLLYDYIDRILGMSSYKDTSKTIRTMCIIFTFIAITTVIIDSIAWIHHLNWIVITNYSIEIMYLGIKLLSSLDCISNSIQIKYRLQTIGDILQNYYYRSDNLPGMVKNNFYNKFGIETQDVVKSDNTNDLNTINNERYNSIQWLSRCYILLNEQCDFLNTKYGFRIFLMFLLFLLDMVLLWNLIIRLLIGTVVIPKGYNIYLPILSATSKIISYTLILFCGIYYCEQNYRQTERIIRLIDQILITKKITKEIQETLKEFKSLIVSRPINYHAMNFYRLDYATLVSMASVIVTYTIILLQNMQ